MYSDDLKGQLVDLFKQYVRSVYRQGIRTSAFEVKNALSEILNTCLTHNMIYRDNTGKLLDKPVRSPYINNTTYSKEQREMFGYTLVEESERLESFDRLLGFAEEYHYSGVLKYFGLSFLEWASMPFNKAKEFLDLARFYAKSEYDVQVAAEKKSQEEIRKASTINGK